MRAVTHGRHSAGRDFYEVEASSFSGGKAFLALEDKEHVLPPAPVGATHGQVACLSLSGRLLVYPLSELKLQAKGGSTPATFANAGRGIRDMVRTPAAVWIVDTYKEHLAVAEARKLNIPVIAILDTNCDPDQVNYPIPGNDDAIRSAGLLTKVIASAVAEGLQARAGAGAADGKPEAGQEPLAEWEQELLAGATAGSEAVATEPPADAS